MTSNTGLDVGLHMTEAPKQESGQAYHLLFALDRSPRQSAIYRAARYFFCEQSAISKPIYFRVYDPYLLKYGWLAIAECSEEIYNSYQLGRKYDAIGMRVRLIQKYTYFRKFSPLSKLWQLLDSNYRNFMSQLTRVVSEAWLQGAVTLAYEADADLICTLGESVPEWKQAIELMQTCHPKLKIRNIENRLKHNDLRMHYAYLTPALDFAGHLKPPVAYALIDANTAVRSSRTMHSFGVVGDYRNCNIATELLTSVLNHNKRAKIKAYVHRDDVIVLKTLHTVGFNLDETVSDLNDSFVWLYTDTA